MPMRRIATITLVVALSGLGAAGCGPGSGDGTTTRLTVSAMTAGGASPDKSALDSTRQVLERRLTGAGFTDVKVTSPAAGQLTVTVGGRHDAAELAGFLAPGDLAFRLILEQAPASGAAAPTGAPPSAASQSGAPPSAAAPTAALPSGASPSAASTAAGELAGLSARQLFDQPDVTCARLDARDATAGFDPDQQLVACDNDDTMKYLMETAAVRGTDVKDATAQVDKMTGQWDVTVSFTADGQQRWTELTRRATTNEGNVCKPNGTDNAGPCAVAIVVDGRVVTAPTIQAVITGDAMISGANLSNKTASQRLAATLRAGRLPLSLKITSTEVVTK